MMTRLMLLLLSNHVSSFIFVYIPIANMRGGILLSIAAYYLFSNIIFIGATATVDQITRFIFQAPLPTTIQKLNFKIFKVLY